VQAHEARDQQLVAQLVGLVAVGDVFDRVVQEQSVAGGAVDDAVEDVRYYFALGGGLIIHSCTEGGIDWGGCWTYDQVS